MYRNDNVGLIGPEQFALLAGSQKAWQRYVQHNGNCYKFLIPIHDSNSLSGNLDWSLVLVDTRERQCILFGDEMSIHWNQHQRLQQMFSTYGVLHIECLSYDKIREHQIGLYGVSDSLHDGVSMLICAHQIVTGATADQSCMRITKDKLKELIHNFEIQ